MKWWWNRGVERRANPLLRECWTFLIYIFLHQQRKQCLEFALTKLREICKYLAGACNSNSHARGLHYLTFVCKTKQGKSMQRGESSEEKCFRRAQRYLSALKCGEVPLRIEFTTSTTTSLWNLDRKGNWRKRNCGHRLIMHSITHRRGECEKRGGGRLLYMDYTWARWNVSGMTICETHKLSNSVKKEIYTYCDLDPGDSRNQMMCRWSSQITSDSAGYSLNPSHLLSPLPPFSSSPFSYPCPYHYLFCYPAHGHTGVFQNNFLWHKLLALIFAINPFCFSFLAFAFLPYIFCNILWWKNACSFLPIIPEISFPALSFVQFFIFLNEPCQLFISKELNHPVNPIVS